MHLSLELALLQRFVLCLSFSRIGKLKVSFAGAVDFRGSSGEEFRIERRLHLKRPTCYPGDVCELIVV